MPKNQKNLFVAFFVLIIVLLVGGYFLFNTKPVARGSISELEIKYNDTAKQYSLMYKNMSDAVKAFKSSDGEQIEATDIVMYVPGKLPREDGNPYFYGRGVVNRDMNQCVVGYMNLVTGVVDSHRDVCVIYN